MKVEKIIINSAFPNQQDITSCHDSYKKYELITTSIDAYVVFNDKTKPPLRIMLEIPALEKDWQSYIINLLSSIES